MLIVRLRYSFRRLKAGNCVPTPAHPFCEGLQSNSVRDYLHREIMRIVPRVWGEYPSTLGPPDDLLNRCVKTLQEEAGHVVEYNHSLITFEDFLRMGIYENIPLIPGILHALDCYRGGDNAEQVERFWNFVQRVLGSETQYIVYTALIGIIRRVVQGDIHIQWDKVATPLLLPSGRAAKCLYYKAWHKLLMNRGWSKIRCSERIEN